ncbi:MAG: WbqC family protein [Actinomycetota bacterium]
MILSGHQPVYLPGIILFNKMAMSDLFMFVGHCQFSPKSWQQRNRIDLGGREMWLSVPVLKRERFGQAIDEVELVDEPWRRKHLGSIRQAYQKRPHFARYFPELEVMLSRPYASLGDLNRSLIMMIRDWLAITTPIVDSRDHPQIIGHKTDMLIQMCQAVGADRYLSNEGSRVYVQEDLMAEAGILHCWQVFDHPVYDQGRQPFLPDMSVIDLVFSLGPDAGEVVKNCGRIEPGACIPAGMVP